MSYIQLSELKDRLIHGDQRKLAGILRVHPSKVANALDGFVKDPEFLESLQAEAQKLIEEREAVKS